MTGPARFTFDLDLGKQRHGGAVIAESAMAELIAAARAEGRALGIAEGERNATARAAKQLAAAADALANRASALAGSLEDARRQAIAEAVEVAIAAARKLAGGLIARQPVAEIEALLAECLVGLEAVPHLVVRCHPELADAIRDTAGVRMATAGFTGRLIVLGEPGIALGDARIEWAEGGVVRDINAISSRIDTAIAAFFAARGITLSDEATQP